MSSEEFDRIVEQRLESRGRDGTVSLKDLTEQERTEATALLEVADLLWEAGHGAPALQEDPVAAMLGLVPDVQCALDPKALTRARKAARLTVGQLADRLTARGWEVTGGDLFRWENRSTAEVPPAVIQAIAEATGTTVGRLTADAGPSAVQESVKVVSETPKFKELARRWARLRGVALEVAFSSLQSRIPAAARRGQLPDTDQWLSSLEELVTAMEHGSQR